MFDSLCQFWRELWYFIILLIFLAAILFYANYLKLPKADSEPTKIVCKLGILANKIHWKKNLRPQNKVEPSGCRTTCDRFWLWVLYHLFLTVDWFWLCLSIVLSFLTGDRFWHCLSFVPSFSDWWQVCSVWELHHLFWLLTGFGPVWVFYIFFWPVRGFGSIWVLHHLLLTVSRFWHCLRIAPSFLDGLQVLALFEYCTIFFWLLTGFGSVWVLCHLFWLVTGFCTVSVLYHLFLTGDGFWLYLSIVPSFSDC